MIAARPSEPLRVAIAGLGAVGIATARAIDAGIDGLTLSAVSAARMERARARVSDFNHPPLVTDIQSLAQHADVVVECAPAKIFREIAEPALQHGCIVIAVSVGALLANLDLVDLARAQNGRIIAPSGALLGLDAVQAAALGEITSVRMITTKPPDGLAGAPYLAENNIDLSNLEAPLLVFSGNAADGARHFPANVNVAAALGLAGIGPEKTTLEIWADPEIRRNRHQIRVESDSANMDLTIENVPSEENPRTGRIVAPSVIATLRKLVSPLVVGT